jgi:hypothetical protein
MSMMVQPPQRDHKPMLFPPPLLGLQHMSSPTGNSEDSFPFFDRLKNLFRGEEYWSNSSFRFQNVKEGYEVYKILTAAGVDVTSLPLDKRNVTKAFKSCRLLLHPDKNINCASLATEAFQILLAAQARYTESFTLQEEIEAGMERADTLIHSSPHPVPSVVTRLDAFHKALENIDTLIALFDAAPDWSITAVSTPLYGGLRDLGEQLSAVHTTDAARGGWTRRQERLRSTHSRLHILHMTATGDRIVPTVELNATLKKLNKLKQNLKSLDDRPNPYKAPNEAFTKNMTNFGLLLLRTHDALDTAHRSIHRNTQDLATSTQVIEHMRHKVQVLSDELGDLRLKLALRDAQPDPVQVAQTPATVRNVTKIGDLTPPDHDTSKWTRLHNSLGGKKAASKSAIKVLRQLIAHLGPFASTDRIPSSTLAALEEVVTSHGGDDITLALLPSLLQGSFTAHQQNNGTNIVSSVTRALAAAHTTIKEVKASSLIVSHRNMELSMEADSARAFERRLAEANMTLDQKNEHLTEENKRLRGRLREDARRHQDNITSSHQRQDSLRADVAQAKDALASAPSLTDLNLVKAQSVGVIACDFFIGKFKMHAHHAGQLPDNKVKEFIKDRTATTLLLRSDTPSSKPTKGHPVRLRSDGDPLVLFFCTYASGNKSTLKATVNEAISRISSSSSRTLSTTKTTLQRLKDSLKIIDGLANPKQGGGPILNGIITDVTLHVRTDFTAQGTPSDPLFEIWGYDTLQTTKERPTRFTFPYVLSSRFIPLPNFETVDLRSFSTGYSFPPQSGSFIGCLGLPRSKLKRLVDRFAGWKSRKRSREGSSRSSPLAPHFLLPDSIESVLKLVSTKIARN